MDFFSLGSNINYSDFNAIVYLLRKFKRLTSDLRLGSNRIGSDYGTYNVTGGLTSVGGNFILEDTVTIRSSDVLLNCFYTFNFTVVDVNLSGTVNRRVISVTGDTGDNGVLEVVLEPSLLESDEVILPDFKVDIVFDEHEYYTPVSSLDITLEVDKSYVSVGETNTVTATVLDDAGTPVEDLELQFNFNGSIVTDITDEDGVASASYTGTGAGWVNVLVNGKSIQFYDGYVTVTEFTGDSITLGKNTFQSWLGTVGNVVIDWGDGSTDTVNNPTQELSHTYTDGLSEHSIAFIGEVTSLGEDCFYQCTGLTSVSIPPSVTSLGISCFRSCTSLTSVTIPSSVTSLRIHCFNGCTSLTSVTIPDSVTSLGMGCFYGCTGLTSIIIPNSVTNLGFGCFDGCTSLIDYQLYWEIPSRWYEQTMPNNPNTIYTIPYETTNNYLSKNYPSNKLRERGLNLQLTADKPIIQSSETSTITATLTHDEEPLTSKTLSYQIKHGSTVISTGTKTTNSSGQATISYTGTGVGDVSVIVSYGSLLQETYEVKDGLFRDTSTNPNNKWWSTATNGSITHDSSGVIFNNVGTGYSRMHPYTVETLPSTWSEKENAVKFLDTPFIVEFDVKSISNTNVITLDTNSTLYSNDVSPNDHVKLICDGSTGKVYINDVEVNSKSFTFTNSWFAFRITSTVELTIDNFVIYSI